MPKSKKFMVTTTENRRSAFLEACNYLNLDLNRVIEQQMLAVCKAALREAEMQQAGVSMDDAARELNEVFGGAVQDAFWNPKMSGVTNGVLHGVG